MWQKKRREINHDWLKNRFIVALNSWLRLLDGEIEDKMLEQSFLTQVLPQWEVRRQEISALLREFPSAMSPRQLFDEPPLSRCDNKTKEWLGEFMHALWLTRVSAESLTATAEATRAAADRAYADILQVLKNREPGDLKRAIKPYRDLCDRFRNACQELGAALSEFPHEIKVV